MYGLLIAFSILISALFLEKQIKHENKNPDTLWGLIFWTILAGLLGARLYHVLDLRAYYLLNPLQIFAVWNGGLGVLGGIIFGLTGAIIYLILKHEPILEWLDRLAAWAPFIQSVSRWGNYFNQELYGKKTTLPWGIYITNQNARFHPLFLYESILDLLQFIFLRKLSHKKLKNGVITLSYLIGYSSIRIVLEEFRISPWQIIGLNVAQLVSILIILGSVIFLIYENKRK